MKHNHAAEIASIQAWTGAHQLHLTTLLDKAVLDDGAVELVQSGITLPNRDTYMKLVCGICKCMQIAWFCASGTGTSTTPVTDCMSLTTDYAAIASLFARSRKLGDGGIGGDREVQSVDELMLQLSVRHRRLVLSASSTTARGTHTPILTPGVLAGMHFTWAGMLLSAMSVSTHNYCFPLEALEPFRALGAGKACLEMYQKLGVKHIQVSLSYTFASIPSIPSYPSHYIKDFVLIIKISNEFLL